MTLFKLFAIAAAIPLAVTAQSIEVTRDDARIDGLNAPGYQVTLPGNSDEVSTYLTKYFKTLGKTRTSGDFITVSDATVESRKYAQPIYGTVKQAGASASAWIGIPRQSGEEQSADDPKIRRLVYDFAVFFHRGKIQLQVDESLRALQAVEKQQLRLLNQHKDLDNRTEANKREKAALEKSLVENKLELEDLTKKIAENARARDSVALATDQIRKVVEMHQEKLRNVK